MAKRILIVEDEPKTAAFLRESLEEDGYEMEMSADGREALDLALRNPFDCIILDVMLPGKDGLSVVKMLRRMNNSVPVLMLSARGGMNERVEGLDAGADDYLPKPFGLPELLARVKALTRRGGEAKAILLTVADLTMDVAQREVWRDSKKIVLSPREFRLLEVLMRHSPNACSRSSLLGEAWDYHFDPGTNLVDVYIRRLRDKIEFGFSKKLLHTVKGIGYVLGDAKS